jgi:hypothetical protein
MIGGGAALLACNAAAQPIQFVQTANKDDELFCAELIV